jgi:hypothetical protein
MDAKEEQEGFNTEARRSRRRRIGAKRQKNLRVLRASMLKFPQSSGYAKNSWGAPIENNEGIS